MLSFSIFSNLKLQLDHLCCQKSLPIHVAIQVMLRLLCLPAKPEMAFNRKRWMYKESKSISGNCNHKIKVFQYMNISVVNKPEMILKWSKNNNSLVFCVVRPLLQNSLRFVSFYEVFTFYSNRSVGFNCIKIVIKLSLNQPLPRLFPLNPPLPRSLPPNPPPPPRPLPP